MVDDVNGAVCGVGWEVVGVGVEGRKKLNATRDETQYSLRSFIAGIYGTLASAGQQATTLTPLTTQVANK